MSSVTATNAFDALGLGAATTAPGKSRSTLGQQDFLSLMTAQLKNQDPTKPMDNNEFMSQMAQFSTVSGINDLNKSFASFAVPFIPIRRCRPRVWSGIRCWHRPARVSW